MTSKHIFGLLSVFALGLLCSCRTAVIITSSEQDAKIFVNGRQISSTDIVKVKKYPCASIKVEKTGYLTENLTYCYSGTNLFAPKTKYIELKRDDAYDASVKNDYSNKDFEQEVNKKYTEAEAWKIISQIITSYFDNIEMADKETGYMKTSWQTKSFIEKTIRTRIIIKQSSSTPLKYKIKIVSEYANTPDQSVKDDDKFKEWDRILKKYSEIITEFQTRLSAK